MPKLRLSTLISLLMFSSALLASENGVTDGKIILGQSAVFSGDSAELGIRANLGAMAYFDALNARGGVAGRKVTLLKDDDNFEPSNALENTNQYIENDKVFALFGYVGSSTSTAALALVNKAKLPFFAPLSGAAPLRDASNRYVFNTRASLLDEIRHSLEQLSVMGIKRIAILYQNDAEGKSAMTAVASAAQKLGLELAETASVERNAIAIGATGVSAKLLAKKPDAVIQLCSYLTSANLIKEMRKAGYLGQFFNTSMVGSSAFAAALGKDGIGVSISQVVPLPWNTRSPIVAEYQKAMQKAGHSVYDFTSLEGYIAAKTFSEIASKVGKDLSRERFIKTAETMGNIDLGGYTINFGPNMHNGSSFVEMVVIGKNGSFLR
ncbi:ABC transporter substrate-binding protein [Undibacterium sp.]|uniref:ABC transporter substrate-binding protein n=1 Tax=Undibacterium sp. TaxID=1914977 RepID=UPI0025EEF416|nr:ABC transporter substrate-binding protein [Undibacterium sp.]